MATMVQTQRAKTAPPRPGEPAAAAASTARGTAAAAINSHDEALLALNKAIHAHPEVGYEEVFAHDAIAAFLERDGFRVQRHAYGLATSFSAEAGVGGRLVVICAEYDALPGIGHGCGHNLIATASVAAFVGAARAMRALQAEGRVRILGTPAEEGGGGKIKLLDAGAFAGADAAVMCHALPQSLYTAGCSGTAGFRTTASCRFTVEFRGKTAHAGSEPWNGANALDAAVATYNAVSMLRQHMRPHERASGVIEDGGHVPNIIPDYARMGWSLRSSSVREVEALYAKVKDCIDGAVKMTGCTVEITLSSPYMEMYTNAALCNAYIHEMGLVGDTVRFQDDAPSAAGTDMGNVSHMVPSLHGIFAIPTEPGVAVHSRGFAVAAAGQAAHEAAIRAGKGLAMLATKVLLDEAFAKQVKADFQAASRVGMQL